jgi:hypothetical protein
MPGRQTQVTLPQASGSVQPVRMIAGLILSIAIQVSDQAFYFGTIDQERCGSLTHTLSSYGFG